MNPGEFNTRRGEVGDDVDAVGVGRGSSHGSSAIVWVIGRGE